MTQGQLGGLVKKEKITQEQADAAARGDPRPDHGHHRVRGLRRRRLRDRGRARADGDQAGGVRRARRASRPGHAILASNTSALSITEMGEATTRPDKVVRLPLLLPGVGDAADRGHRGRGDLRGDGQAAANFAMQIRKNPIRCGEAPGFVVNRILNSAALGDLALPGREGRSTGGDRQGDRRGQGHPDGPVLPHRPARASTRCCTSPSTCRRATATASTSIRR